MRGRPPQSDIRQNMINLLQYLKKAYGYQICKLYNQIFPEVTQRVIYYHLKKGLSLGLFEVEKIETEKGDYSWGQQAQKIYYKLGPQAYPQKDPRVKEMINRK